MHLNRRAITFFLIGSLLVPWFPARGQSVSAAQIPKIAEPGGVPTSTSRLDAGDLTPAEQATAAQVGAALGLGADYHIMPGSLARGGRGVLNLQWFSHSVPRAWGDLDPATGNLLGLSCPVNPAPSTVARRSWQSDESAAAHYARLLGGARGAECATTAVSGSDNPVISGVNSYLFPRRENGLAVNSESGREGLEVDLNPWTGSLQSFRPIWTPGLTFPSAQPQLTKEQALADWERNAPPEVVAENGQTYCRLPPPVFASNGKPLQPAKIRLDLAPGQALPPPMAPVAAADATAYLDQLGLLPTGTQWEERNDPYMGGVNRPVPSSPAPSSPAPISGPTGPTFGWVGSMETVGSEVYTVTYTATFDANGRLIRYNIDYQATGPGSSGDRSGLSPGLTGQAWLPQTELLSRATAFLNSWGADPSAWTWQIHTSLPEFGDFGLRGFFHQGGVEYLDGGIQFSLDPNTGQVADFTYSPASAVSSGGPFLDPVVLQKRLLTYFPWELRYQLNAGQVYLVYGLGDSRGAIGLRATDGAPVDGAGHDLTTLFTGPPADVPAWAAAGVTHALANFDLATEADGGFHPGNPVTPEQVLSVLLPLKQGGRLQPVSPEVVGPGEPSILEQAQQNGLLSSPSKPDDRVGRGEIAVWVARVLGFDPLLQMSKVLPTPFADAKGLAVEQQNAIALLYDLGYFRGYPGGRFNPAENVTRAEWAVLLDRLSGDSGPVNPTWSTVARRSWQSDEPAAAHYARLLGGASWAECATTPVSGSDNSGFSDVNSYLFPRRENGLAVNSESGREGLEVDLDSRTGALLSLRPIWTPGLTFPSAKPQLTKEQALADWKRNAPPEVVAGNGQIYFRLLPPVFASSGEPLQPAVMKLDLATGQALPTPAAPVGAAAATAYLDQLGLLPVGSRLETSSIQMGEGLPQPSFGWVGGMETFGSEVYSVTYGATFDGNGRLTWYHMGRQTTGPGLGGGGSGWPGGPMGQAPGPQPDMLSRATAFLEAWGADPTAWTWQTNVSLPEFGGAIGLRGFYHQGGVEYLDGGIQLSMDPFTGQVADFAYTPPPAVSPGGPFLDPAAIQKRLLTYFPWELRYQVSAGQVYLVYGLGDSRGTIGLRATDGAPVDGAGQDLTTLFTGPPSDVPAWAAAGVTYALSNFDLATAADGGFHPGNPVTPEQVLSVLLPLKQRGRLQPVSPEVVGPGEPSILEQAQQNGLLSSPPKPDDQVSRGDLAVWVARALGFDRLLRMSAVLPTRFTDVGGLPTEQQNAIALLYDLGYFQGYSGGRFNPAAVVTRADWAVLLDRLSGD